MADQTKEEMVAQTERSLEAVKHMYSEGQIDEPIYFKYKINVAYDYGVLIGDLKKAEELLQQVSREYYEHYLEHQCQEDAEFTEVVYALAKAFVDSGKVNLSEKYNFHKPPALA